jgi:hypothetical protein
MPIAGMTMTMGGHAPTPAGEAHRLTTIVPHAGEYGPPGLPAGMLIK